MSSSMAAVAPAPASALGQVRGGGGHAGRVHEVARRVLAERGPGHVLLVADRAAPPPPARRLLGWLAAADQQPQVLPDAVDVLARGGDAAPPDADARAARLVDDQAGQAGPQRPGDVPFLLVSAGQRFQQEPAVERGEQPGPAGAGDLRPGRHLGGQQLARIRAAVVQHVADGPGERGDGDLRPVGGPHLRHGTPGRERDRLGGVDHAPPAAARSARCRSSRSSTPR